MTTSQLSRRNLVATAAALPALAVPAAAVAAAVPSRTLAQLADQICAEWDRLGTIERELEDEHWRQFNPLSEQLWSTPASSIHDLAAKARVLDKRLRIDGEVHSGSDDIWGTDGRPAGADGAVMSAEHVDSPPSGWFVPTVCREKSRSWDGGALMVDTDPDDMKNCTCHGPALLWVNPYEYRPGPRVVHQCWVRISGKHRNADSADRALQEMIAGTRH